MTGDSDGSPEGETRGLRVVHVAEGGRWAGIEVHLSNLLPALNQDLGVDAILVALYSGPLTDSLAGRGVGVELADRRGRFDVGVIIRLVRLMRRLSPDVVHMHGYLAVLFGVPAAVLAGVRLKVVTLHASPTPATESWKFRSMLRVKNALIRTSDVRSIAVSQDLLDTHVSAHSLVKEKVRVVRNGIDLAQVRNRPRPQRTALDLPEGRFLVGIVGRIDENKGHIYLLGALETLLEKRHEVHLVVLGDGPKLTSLRASCARMNLTEHVSFLGFRDNVLDYLAALDAMVIASLHEGIPYALLEAMALGVPVVATAVGGIPEVIEDSTSGLLVPPRDPDAIAGCILQLAHDRDLRARLSQGALARVEQCFSHRIMAESTLAAYRDWLAEPPVQVESRTSPAPRPRRAP